MPIVDLQLAPGEAAREVRYRMQSDETVPEFIARAAAAHGPLSEVEVVRLRAIFQPGVKLTPPPASLPEAA